MAKKEKVGAKKDDGAQKKETFVSKTILFFTKYNKFIYGAIIAILVVIIGILAFNRFYLQKKTEKASLLILKPIEEMMKGDSASVMLALEGDDDMDGFLSIIESYKITRTANTARYYAGICYFKLNDKEEALEYLLKFKRKEDIYWAECQALIGDIYDDLDQPEKAIKHYEKSVKASHNPYATPVTLFKLGQLYEREEKWEKALNAYKQIEKDYYGEFKNMGVERFIDRAQGKLDK